MKRTRRLVVLEFFGQALFVVGLCMVAFLGLCTCAAATFGVAGAFDPMMIAMIALGAAVALGGRMLARWASARMKLPRADNG
jgi:hypothetical protein